mmetsp:Transcript_14690/g.16987  ORF Transcript_14690/g.16987 Transcript_14690/m.16987 type:complete len:283 (+) Transcript_14690:344-1192(+)
MLQEMKPPGNSEGRSVTQGAPSDTLGIIAQSSNAELGTHGHINETNKTAKSEKTDNLDNMNKSSKQELDESKVNYDVEKPSDAPASVQPENDTAKDEADNEAKDNIEKPKETESKEEDKSNKTKAPGGRLALARLQEQSKAKELEMKLQQEKKQYHHNMFGVDFNIDVISESNFDYQKLKIQEFKDETMKALQEKSFRGLYLRLQFWINQVYKSLHSKLDGCNFRLCSNHVMIMKSIVCFLTYMRDVVMELKLHRVTDYDSYEWQKQMRLTWNATEPGCKVE